MLNDIIHCLRFCFSSELQLEMRRREQRKLEEEQEELQKWRKKLRDRQLEDEEFKVIINTNIYT